MMVTLPGRQSIIRIALLVALGAIAMWAWLLFNIYIIMTSAWVDVLFGCMLVFLFLLLTPNIPQHIQKNIWFRASSILILLFAGYAGILYVYGTKDWFLYFVVTPFDWLNELLGTTGFTGFTVGIVLRFTAAYLVASLLGILISLCGRVIFLANLGTIQTFVQSILKKTSLRPSRIRHGVTVGINSLASIIILWGIVSILLNINAPLEPARIRTIPGPTGSVTPGYLAQRADGTLPICAQRRELGRSGCGLAAGEYILTARNGRWHAVCECHIKCLSPGGRRDNVAKDQDRARAVRCEFTGGDERWDTVCQFLRKCLSPASGYSRVGRDPCRIT
jgi:hypothetical protein